MKIICRAIFLLVLFLEPGFAYSVTLPGIPEFIDEMVAKHQFRQDELTNVFARAQHRPAVIEAISRPATIKPWLEYRAAFVNRKRIDAGLLFWNKYRHSLHRAEQKYGVPQEIIVAVIGVETLYGENVGKFRVLDALTTLAFDYPRRAEFFRMELENYLLLAREQQFDLLSIRGSYAGAMGIPQFMPSSYRKYAVDFNGNHRIDLLREDRDAIGSVANYLQGYGWARNEPITVQTTAENADSTPEKSARLVDFTVGQGKQYWLAHHNFEVITRYNNSDFYAMSVFQLAEELKAARRGRVGAGTHLTVP